MICAVYLLCLNERAFPRHVIDWNTACHKIGSIASNAWNFLSQANLDHEQVAAQKQRIPPYTTIGR